MVPCKKTRTPQSVAVFILSPLLASRRLQHVIAVTFIISTILASYEAQGAAFFWNSGGGTYNWSEGANWSTGLSPANNGSSDLFFGALAVPYLTVANIPGSTVFGSFFGSVVAGGEINGITFLPAAGSYDVQATSLPGSFDGIMFRSGGIINQSINLQTFNTRIYYDSRFSTSLDAGTGGLRFNSGFGTLGGGDHNITLSGAGPYFFAGFTRFHGGFTSGGGVIAPTVKSGGGTATFENGLTSIGTFVVNGGAIQITGNYESNASTLNGLIVNANSSAALSSGGRLALYTQGKGVDINSGALTVTGFNTRLDANRDALFPQPDVPFVLSTIGNSGDTGSIALTSNAVGAFDTLIVGHTGIGTLNVLSGSDVSTKDRGFIGNGVGASGTAIVSGAGSTWTSVGSLFIGNLGSGSLQVSDAGQVATTGNSYLGFSPGANGTAIVSGPFSTWNSAATLAIGGNLAAAGGTGLLSIENGGAVGANQVLLYNTGTLALVGDSTLSAPLTIFGGLIRTSGESTLASAINIQASGVFVDTLLPSTNTTFSGNIDGVGGLTKRTALGITGMGKLILTGTSTYAGPTTIDAGTLLVDGSITSATTVNSGATFGGSGIVGTVDFKSGSTLAPGNSTGLLTTSDTTLRAGSSYQFELRSDSSGAAGIDWDSLAIGGTLDISDLTPANPLILRLRTLDGANVVNPLDVWNPGLDHTWASIVSTTDGFVGTVVESLFQVDTSDFLSSIQGAFSVVQNGLNLDLQYKAPAVSETLLVSNLSEPLRDATAIGNNPNPVDTPQGPSVPWSWGAQAFVSDNQPHQLTSIAALVGDGSLSPSPIVVAQLHADNGGVIGDLITTFTAPDVTGPLNALTFLPDGTVILDPNTQYWFVLGSEAPGDGTFFMGYADSNLSVGPGALGNFADSSDSGMTWNYGDASFPYFIQVNVANSSLLPGDFDLDGDVDGRDFLVWQRGGSPNGINSGDLALWQAQYGSALPLSANANVVPEPASICLLLALLVCVSGYQRK